MKNETRSFLSALLIATTFAVSRAGAEEPSPSCYVLCDLGQLREFGSKTKMLQDQTSQLIAERLKLKKNFPYWSFKPGDGTSYPFLRVSVVNDDRLQWLLSVSLVLNDHDEKGYWRGVLLKPGEVYFPR